MTNKNLFQRGGPTTIYWVAFIIPIDEQKSFSEGWVYNHQPVKYITFCHMPYAMEPLTINDHHGEKPKTPMTVLQGGAGDSKPTFTSLGGHHLDWDYWDTINGIILWRNGFLYTLNNGYIYIMGDY